MIIQRLTALLLLGAICSSTHAQVDLEKQLKSLEEQRTTLDAQRERLTDRVDSAKLAIIRRDLQRIALPKLEAGDEVIVHPGHMLV
ncbi:MAG: hypothetical protein KBG86_15005, partial [Flavobacteriales bacterium]|nr:hypothetical protein [Flavobacteriales bacterium]